MCLKCIIRRLETESAGRHFAEGRQDMASGLASGLRDIAERLAKLEKQLEKCKCQKS